MIFWIIVLLIVSGVSYMLFYPIVRVIGLIIDLAIVVFLLKKTAEMARRYGVLATIQTILRCVLIAVGALWLLTWQTILYNYPIAFLIGLVIIIIAGITYAIIVMIKKYGVLGTIKWLLIIVFLVAVVIVAGCFVI